MRMNGSYELLLVSVLAARIAANSSSYLVYFCVGAVWIDFDQEILCHGHVTLMHTRRILCIDDTVVWSDRDFETFCVRCSITSGTLAFSSGSSGDHCAPAHFTIPGLQEHVCMLAFRFCRPLCGKMRKIRLTLVPAPRSLLQASEDMVPLEVR